MFGLVNFAARKGISDADSGGAPEARTAGAGASHRSARRDFCVLVFAAAWLRFRGAKLQSAGDERRDRSDRLRWRDLGVRRSEDALVRRRIRGVAGRCRERGEAARYFENGAGFFAEHAERGARSIASIFWPSNRGAARGPSCVCTKMRLPSSIENLQGTFRWPREEKLAPRSKIMVSSASGLRDRARPAARCDEPFSPRGRTYCLSCAKIRLPAAG